MKFNSLPMLKLRALCTFMILNLFTSSVMAYSSSRRAINSRNPHYKLEPAVATSYNLRQITDAMQSECIERSEVAGLNDS